MTKRRKKTLNRILSLLGAIALTSLMSPLDAQPASKPASSGKAKIQVGDWYRQTLTGMEVGPTGAQFGYSDPKDTRYCANFDGRAIVRRCVAAHAQYLVLWARDGDFAYYNSRLLPKAPGLGARDPLREAIAEAKPSHLPVLAYCVVQQGGHYLKAHPEFEMRGMDGKPLGRFCLNSGYLDAMKQIVAELLQYPIAGFHIDMLDQGFGPPYGCWCEHCQRKFAAMFGHKMPAAVSWDTSWEEMLEFRYRSSEQFEKALRDTIKSLNPQATVDFNYHGNPPFSWEVGQRPVQHAGNGDFVTGETGQWGFSALGVGLNAEFYRAATPGKRCQVAMQRGVRMYHDQTTRPLADIRWELFTLLAHGAFVTMVDKTGFDGRLDPVAYQRIGAAFQEAYARRSQFGQEPVYDVGLYFSARARDWHGRENAARCFQSFQGAQKACAYEHLTYGVLLDENLTLVRLQAFPVVCLPNVTILSEREVRLFQRYVEAGGKLLITGQSGLFDAYGAPLTHSTLEELIGAQVVRPLTTLDNWARLEARSPQKFSELHASIPPDWDFLVEGPAVAYRPTTATALGLLSQPARTSRQKEGAEGTDWPMSADAPVGPAVLIHPMGKGMTLTLAASPDFAVASDHSITEARKLFSNAIRFLHPARRVEIAAPANVETIVTDDPKTRSLRVHFLAYNSLPQTMPASGRPYVLPGLAEEAPLFRATLRVRFPVKSVTAWNQTTRINRRENRIEATINDIYETLVLKY